MLNKKCRLCLKCTEKVEVHFVFVCSLCNPAVRQESYERGKQENAKKGNTDVQYPDIKKHTIFRNPKKPKKPRFIKSFTASKDPRNCSSLLFHDTHTFNYALLLLHDPVCVLPIEMDDVPSYVWFKHWTDPTGLHTIASGTKLLRNLVLAILKRGMSIVKAARLEANAKLERENKDFTMKSLEGVELTWTREMHGEYLDHI